MVEADKALVAHLLVEADVGPADVARLVVEQLEAELGRRVTGRDLLSVVRNLEVLTSELRKLALIRASWDHR